MKHEYVSVNINLNKEQEQDDKEYILSNNVELDDFSKAKAT